MDMLQEGKKAQEAVMVEEGSGAATFGKEAAGEKHALSRESQLGDRLIQGGLISAAQCDAALQYQKDNGGLLGAAIVALGFVSQEEMAAFFQSGQSALSGERMVEKGLITPEQLMQALSYQAENGGRLGNVVVALDFATVARVEEFFAKAENPKKNMKLGERLVENKTITQEELDHALRIQLASGGLLGDVLLSLKYITPKQLQDALATQMQMGRIGAKKDFTDAKRLPYRVALRHNVVIINTRQDAYILAVRELLDTQALEEVQGYFDKPLEQVMATMTEIETCWEAVYQGEALDDSVYKLLNEQPQNSARSTLSTGQKIVFGAIIVTIIAFLIYDYRSTLLVLNIIAQIIYATLSIFKFWILARGHRAHNQLRFTKEEVDAVDERALPIFSILVPVYKEASIVPLIVERLGNLDYPQHKLDIRILLEEDDVETLEAFKRFDLPSSYTLIVVPDSQPRTKPKACNYGLLRARGEFVVIYDAEDMPEADQLKKVYLAFKELPDNYACIQAKLNYYNSRQNLLTRWFTHEYSTWFDDLLVGVMTFDFPLPLGGTSNHFRTDLLRKIGAWDPFNVTEDADLGIRLHKLRYKTAVLDSYTFEEANSKLKNWVRQRSRWIKGYLQTWLVHMRNPLKFLKSVGITGFAGFQAMMLGTPLIPLMNPLFWGMTIVWYVIKPPIIQTLFPGALYYLASAQLILGNFIFIYSNLVGTYTVIRDGELKGKMHLSYSIVIAGILMPIYWMLMTAGAYLALFQLIVKPHYWEKTDHGLTTQVTHNPVMANMDTDEEVPEWEDADEAGTDAEKPKTSSEGA